MTTIVSIIMSENKSSDLGKVGLATIWAIGVGSALGGDFFGWQVILFYLLFIFKINNC